ncbi:MAG: TonB-dependent receptor, partial [Pseudoxanthomonas sp.]
TQAHKQTSDTFQAALGGKWHNDRVTLSSELAYTWSVNKHRAMTLDMGMDAPRMHMTDAGGVPNTWATNFDGSPFGVTNPGNWYLSQYYDSWDQQKGEEWAWRGDSNIKLDAGPISSIDAGVRVSRRTASNHGGGPGAMDNLTGNRISLDGVPGLADVTPGNMLDGARPFGTDRWASANANYLLQQTAQLRTLMGQSPDTPAELASLYFDDREDNYAAYLQVNYGFTLGNVPVDGRIGVRATRLESSLSGTRTTDGVDAPTKIEQSQTKYLPNLNANFSLTETLILRAAASQTIARPAFADLNPQLSLFESTDSLPARGNGGNPDLRAVESKNADLSLEWYFKPGSLLSVAGFHRKIDGYVQNYAADEVIGDVTYSITRPRNTGQGTLKGVEVGYTQFYDFLPGWLSGFGTQLNYTHISAEAESPAGIMQPLTNVSENAFNAILMYQYDRFSARVAYNRRGDYATSFNSSGDQPSEIRQGNEEWLDVAFNYDLNDHMTVFAEATNLLGTTTYNSFGNSQFPRDFASPERTYTVGFRFRL